MNFVRTMVSVTSRSDYIPRYYDVGMNLSDTMFQGIYHGRKRHNSDLNEVLKRAKSLHVEKMLLTGSSLKESEWTLEKAQKYQSESLEDEDGNKVYPQLACTVGVHPCTVKEFEENPDIHLSELSQLIEKYLDTGLVKAFGEIGLDYDRLQFSPADLQRKYFELQLKLASKYNLPLFLHMRNACDDFLSILEPFLDGTRADGIKLQNRNCLVHSFSGTKEDLQRMLRHDSIWFSVNGCSLKTQDNCDAASQIPLDRLLIETDAPWCEIKRTHAAYKYLKPYPNEFYPEDNRIRYQKIGRTQPGTLHSFLPMVVVKPEKLNDYSLRDQFTFAPLTKSRNEPCMIGLVAQVMSRLEKCDPQTLTQTCYKNSEELFG